MHRQRSRSQWGRDSRLSFTNAISILLITARRYTDRTRNGHEIQSARPTSQMNRIPLLLFNERVAPRQSGSDCLNHAPGISRARTRTRTPRRIREFMNVIVSSVSPIIDSAD